MNMPTNLADKIAVANTLAAYLEGTDFSLLAELTERGLEPLCGDYEFRRVLDERIERCPECNGWVATDTDCGCGEDEWDDEE